jgi:hypothetical protein
MAATTDHGRPGHDEADALYMASNERGSLAGDAFFSGDSAETNWADSVGRLMTAATITVPPTAAI